MLIDRLLSSPAIGVLARVLVTFVFWSSGLAKLFDFAGAVAEMEKYGVLPAAPMAALVIIIQLGGSALLISGWNVWLGAGALGVFTALAIPIHHAFWAMTPQTDSVAVTSKRSDTGNLLAGFVDWLVVEARPVIPARQLELPSLSTCPLAGCIRTIIEAPTRSLSTCFL